VHIIRNNDNNTTRILLGVDPAFDSSSTAPRALIGGVTALVIAIAAALVILGFCFRRRKRTMLARENGRDIGEFQNPAFIGDPKLDVEPQQASHHYAEPQPGSHHYLEPKPAPHYYIEPKAASHHYEEPHKDPTNYPTVVSLPPAARYAAKPDSNLDDNCYEIVK
jgi:hypothetical protein